MRAPLEAIMGRHQLSILTGGGGFAGHAWVFGRYAIDFQPGDLSWAIQLQPVLMVLERLYSRPFGDQFRPDAGSLARVGLSQRELDILSLLAQGFTAASIARLRRISSNTVRKHLQNAYAKLGVHDRLTAVNTARRLGLIRGHEKGRADLNQ